MKPVEARHCQRHQVQKSLVRKRPNSSSRDTNATLYPRKLDGCQHQLYRNPPVPPRVAHASFIRHRYRLSRSTNQCAAISLPEDLQSLAALTCPIFLTRDHTTVSFCERFPFFLLQVNSEFPTAYAPGRSLFRAICQAKSLGVRFPNDR